MQISYDMRNLARAGCTMRLGTMADEELNQRYQALSLLDCDDDIPSASESSAGHGADNNDMQNPVEDASVRQHGCNVLLDDGESLNSDSSACSDCDVESDEDGDCSIGNPFLTDGYGNKTTWRLSDLNAEFTKYLEEQANKPKEKKLTKEERLKVHSNRMERYMKSALQKYNAEEKLSEDMYFEFDKVQCHNWIVEGDYDNQFYYHFNFSATQACSTTCLFFAEAIPNDGDSFDTSCKLLTDGDNGHCYGCKNAHVDDMRHPACGNVYVGGHIDQTFPFMIDTESEDDSD